MHQKKTGCHYNKYFASIYSQTFFALIIGFFFLHRIHHLKLWQKKKFFFVLLLFKKKKNQQKIISFVYSFFCKTFFNKIKCCFATQNFLNKRTKFFFFVSKFCIAMTSPSNIAVAFGYVRDVSLLVGGNRLPPFNIAFTFLAMSGQCIAFGYIKRQSI